MNHGVSLTLLLAGMVWLGMLIWSAIEILGAPEAVRDDDEPDPAEPEI